MAQEIMRGVVRFLGFMLVLVILWAWIVGVLYPVADQWFPSLDFSSWARSLIVGMFYIGLPMALVLAFAGPVTAGKRPGESQRNE